MAVRNFWIEAQIDGRKTILKGGPRRKDGGMSITLYVRKDGGIRTALHIECTSGRPPCELSDDLRIDVYLSGELEAEDQGGHIIYRSKR